MEFTPPFELYAPFAFFLCVVCLAYVCCERRQAPLLPRYRTPGPSLEVAEQRQEDIKPHRTIITTI